MKIFSLEWSPVNVLAGLYFFEDSDNIRNLYATFLFVYKKNIVDFYSKLNCLCYAEEMVKNWRVYYHHDVGGDKLEHEP